ncbi:hypothetical protein E7V67_015870 [[Empedobacter] haloabium]|uniref:Flagellar hook-length control protein FliK n=1 Tax=[Empedobacter] haloabium TaxID=592317 RepID=A0ABZ1UG58_9BURK
MAINRLAPTAPTITERTSREPTGQQPRPGLPQPAATGPAAPFALEPGLPAAVGAVLEAMDGQLLASAAPAALAGKAALDSLLADTGAMQPNQLFASRQLVWQTPDTSVLAASWQVMVRNYAEQRAALQQQTEGRRLPSGLFRSEQAGAVLQGGRVSPEVVAETEAWKFAVYAWGAEKLVLRVVTLSPDEDEASDRRGRRPAVPRVALRLEVFLPDMGKVVVQMEPAPGGVLLDIGAAQQAAMQHMRTLLPQIAVLANRCGITIGRARMMRELPAAAGNQPTGRQVAQLTPALFRTMAEVAVLLSQPLPADELFFEPRG